MIGKAHKLSERKDILKLNGYVRSEKRGKGSHEVWHNAIGFEFTLVTAIGKDNGEVNFRKSCKAAGILWDWKADKPISVSR